MQRDNETRLQYLLRLKAELLLENIVEDDVRELLDERQETQPKAKRDRPANSPQQSVPPRLQIQSGSNGNGPAFRNDPRRLPAPEQNGDDQP